MSVSLVGRLAAERLRGRNGRWPLVRMRTLRLHRVCASVFGATLRVLPSLKRTFNDTDVALKAR